MAFAFQGTRGLWEPDEGRYSAVGVHMAQGGDWLVPTLDGVAPHLTKPPITYWALAASFKLLGYNEWAARLPNALAYIGTGLFLFGLGRRLCPRKPWVPSVVWALSLAPVVAANIVTTDSLLVLFETAAMYAFVEAQARAGGDARNWYLGMWLAWGLAFMTKGPPGLLPLVAMTAMFVIHDRTRLRALYPLAGVLLFVVVGFSWFAIIVAQQPDRLGHFLGYEVYGRVFTSAQHRNPQWYGAFRVYVPVLLAGTLPWLVVAIIAAGGLGNVWQALRKRMHERDPQWLLLAYWLLVPLTVFFFARSRLDLYVLPLFVPLALIMARPLSRWRGLEGRRGPLLIGSTAAVLLALKATVAYWPSNRDANDFSAQLRKVLAAHPVDEIVFVGMRPLYGLILYLPQRVDGLEIDERRFDYSTHLTRQQLCGEIARRENAVYVMKAKYAPVFEQGLLACTFEPTRIGSVHADENDLILVTVRTGAL